jgi:hypothetical protein
LVYKITYPQGTVPTSRYIQIISNKLQALILSIENCKDFELYTKCAFFLRSPDAGIKQDKKKEFGKETSWIEATERQ